MFSILNILFLFPYVFSYNTFDIRIVKSPVIKYFPNIRMHHFVLIDDFNSDSLYAVDFTPSKELDNMSIFKLIIGETIPAEIRLRKLHYKSLFYKNKDNEKIISLWHNINVLNKNHSKELTQLVKSSIKNEEISDYLNSVWKWEDMYTELHMYLHNCQTFGKYCCDIFNEHVNNDCEEECDL